MNESPTQSQQAITTTTNTTTNHNSSPEIPVEIISDEEMALLEAAMASAVAATPSPSLPFPSSASPHLPESLRRSQKKAITHSSNRNLSGCSSADIEDFAMKGNFRIINNQHNKMKNGIVKESLLDRFRRYRGLSVTDLTATEWCEKQMEFSLFHGKPEKTEAMKVGSARHTALEEEVVTRTTVEVKSREDAWALKFINFVVGANQLVFERLTREIPLIGFVEGVWISGVIDEIRMPNIEAERFPTLVDTKTRVRATPPTEPQRRNGRLQLMCYKHLWDTLVADKFPSGLFFDYFSLDPNSLLSSEIREHTANSGLPAETLKDLVKYYTNTFSTLPPANDQLLLRYELQEDQSLLGEDRFEYDPDWLNYQIKSRLEFWVGDREAYYVSEDEGWKCRFCKFNSMCPIAADGTPT